MAIKRLDKPFKRPESVLVLIYNTNTEVLLLQRVDDPSFWQSVTGSLEPGETPLAAAQRELGEETGISQPVVDQQQHTRFLIRGPWRKRYAPEVTHNVEHRFSVCVPASQTIELQPEEHLAFQWVAATQARQQVQSATNKALIDDLLVAR